MSADAQKQAAGEAAAALVEAGHQVIGLGTGSTAAFFVQALARRLEEADWRGRVCVATSEATAALAASLGLTIEPLDAIGACDITVDGADEIGPGLALIKGGGAALLREKLVWEASRRCVAIADAGKKVERLGRFPLPIEVVRFGHVHTARRIADVAVEFDMPPARLRKRDGELVLTDGGNLIYDLACGVIEHPAALADALKALTGVVEHGLFLDLADEALLGTDSGIERLEP